MLKRTQKGQLRGLLRKYINGTANSKERAFVEKYYQYFDAKADPSKSLSEGERSELENRMLKKIHAQIAQQKHGLIIPFNKGLAVRIAAAVLFLIITGGLIYVFNHRANNFSSPVTIQQDIKAGTNGAILKLANGRTIVLDTMKNGSLWQNNLSSISKTDSAVAFTVRYPSTNTNTAEYNTLTTPRAHQERLILSDGTKVWLNAASSVKFPTAFYGPQRVVEITGEAYFEVAEDARHPFIVKVHGIKIKVLGTHFNVMAYDNEQSLKTTLFEGSVKIIQPMRNRSQIMSPGEQVEISNKNGKLTLIPHVDMGQVSAWKNGMMVFNNADIGTIMRDVERWYDVKVIYQGAIPKRTFSGEIPRNASLADVLRLFEVNEIHFDMDATTREITVMP